MISTHRDIAADLVLDADVVIVGSGAGGAPVAYELSRAGQDVVLLEEGGRYGREVFNRRPYEMLQLLYRDASQTGTLGRPGIPVPLGRTLGGTTTVNSGTCFRTPARVIERWRTELGVPVSAEILAPYYERAERAIHVAVPPIELIGKHGLVVKRGADALGLSSGIIPRNIDGCQGSGVCCFGCPTGAKQATALSYLPKASDLGARIFANVRVDRIITRGDEATGVEGVVLEPPLDRPTHRVRVRARAVVVSCGTVMTPLLLSRSGIGRRNAWLGRNLHLHPAAKIVAVFDEEIRCWEGIPQSYYVDHLAASDGVMMETASVPPGLSAISIPLAGERHRQVMEEIDHVAVCGLLVSDTSSGRVERSRLDGRPLMIYRLNRFDASRLAKGLKLLARVFFAAGARKLYSPIYGIPVIREPAEIDRIDEAAVRPEHLELVAFHPMGTARMGRDPARSATDPWGKLHGYRNIHVLDGSILPTSLDVNPMLTIMALAIRGSDAILEAWPAGRRTAAAAPRVAEVAGGRGGA